MSYDDDDDDDAPDYNRADEIGRSARRELISQASRAPICATCGQRHARYGKWIDGATPHTGWACTRVEDLGEIAATCEMCEHEPIRFTHHMAHPDDARALVCGCICAGHMEGDVDAARARDAEMRKEARRRATVAKSAERRAKQEAAKAEKLRQQWASYERWLQETWLDPGWWQTSRKGNEYRNFEGFNIVVYPVGNGWGGRITHRESDTAYPSSRLYETSEHAKQAALGALRNLRDKHGARSAG